jgi:hypothetical protein
MHNSRRISLALGVALASGVVVLAFAGAATAVAGPTVTVRIEGESATLLPATPVTLSAPEPVSGCPADSVAAAINLAVNGNWDHGEAFGGGAFTDTILGETHAFTNNSDTWAEWVNYKWGGGICKDLLGNGDEVLMVADHEPESAFFAPTVLPLVVTGAPAGVQVGVPFTVKVSAIHTAPEAEAKLGEGTPEPAEGVTVSGAGATTAVTGANGVATITLTSPGSVTLRATKSGDAPSASFVVSGSSVPQPGGPVLAATPYTGPYAVVAKAAGVVDNHVYPRKEAPKVLSGTVLAHTAVASVSLELRRSYKGRCYAFNGVSTRFVRARCGQGSFFKVSNDGVFSYLLPSALAPGRYVLDIEASDAAGNHTTLARGSSRVVFYVR